MFNIHSVDSNTELIFTSMKEENCQVELRGSGFHVISDLWSIEKFYDLMNFFDKLATLLKPWHDLQKWDSIEGELSLSATCDTVGHVTFLIEIHNNFGGPEEWFIQAGIVTELGQLPKISKQARAFFQNK